MGVVEIIVIMNGILQITIQFQIRISIQQDTICDMAYIHFTLHHYKLCLCNKNCTVYQIVQGCGRLAVSESAIKTMVKLIANQIIILSFYLFICLSIYPHFCVSPRVNIPRFIPSIRHIDKMAIKLNYFAVPRLKDTIYL